MVTAMNTIKRPLIFIKDLPDYELDNLFNLINFYEKYEEPYPKNIQIFTQLDGSLDIVDSLVVDEVDEIVCTTYDEFLSHWNHYKLWVLL